MPAIRDTWPYHTQTAIERDFRVSARIKNEKRARVRRPTLTLIVVVSDIGLSTSTGHSRFKRV
jgi:hypothetical protein